MYCVWGFGLPRASVCCELNICISISGSYVDDATEYAKWKEGGKSP